MKLLRIYPSSINERFIAEATAALSSGQPLIYPTDSMYAVGCDALDNRAIERLCAAKGINPSKDLLSIICSDISMASEYAVIDNRAFALLKRYTPGPVTFILPASSQLPRVFKGRRTVGIRIPDNPIATALASSLGHPLLSTTATIAGADDPDDPEQNAASAEAVSLAYASKVGLMIDGGSCPGIPTTVVDLTDSRSPETVRAGAVEIDL